ncbi:PTS transporter subunit EIIB [Streptococcus sp. A11]|uniref:PTS transporter subunit EIIB n=1 Tax=unclassified Streptococcus TaxID=2608887 RepID=UPI00374CB3FE
MGHRDLGRAILEGVGGKANVSSLTHCATRLRFALVDKSKADQAGLEQLEGVLGVIDKGGRFCCKVLNLLSNKVE